MRNATNSKWYIPLVASTESVSRSGGLGEADPDDLIGNLPDPCKQPWPGMVLWLDANSATSIQKTGTAIFKVLDRSGKENHATQGNPALRPVDLVPGLNFKD
jgi:hypothetical protein